MKIKIYIVTYNNSKELNNTLKTMSSNNLVSECCEIYIINNHSNFLIEEKFKNKVKVLHNVLRPDFSTGYLSRNWNQALILGFEDLENPQSDIVIACQDDTYFYPNWISNLLELHKKYSFVTYGWGDNFMSWKPEAVKRIGLFDERFLFGHVGADYFLRALLFNKEKSSVNDYYHGRVFNPEKTEIAKRPHENKIHSHERIFNRKMNYSRFSEKWGMKLGTGDTKWSKEFIDNCPAKVHKPQYILYPYFEKDIETLKEQYSNL